MSSSRHAGGGGGGPDRRRDDRRDRNYRPPEHRNGSSHRDDRSRNSNSGGPKVSLGQDQWRAAAPPPQRLGGSASGSSIVPNNAFSEALQMTDLPKTQHAGKCRLFIGNVASEVKEDELRALFAKFGEVSEFFQSSKGFAFLKLDSRAQGEAAREALDQFNLRGKALRVKFASSGASVRLKELLPTTSNELLYHAFSQFGEVERAVHIVDDKGRSTGEGIVEFSRKASATDAVQRCRDSILLLSTTPRPAVVEMLEIRDEEDGLTERSLQSHKNSSLVKERELGPRWAAPGSFEAVCGRRWKELYEAEKQARATLEEDLRRGRQQLEQELEMAHQDFQADMLRQELQRRQEELDRLEAARRDRVTRQQAPPPSLMNPHGIDNGPSWQSSHGDGGAFLQGPPPPMWSTGGPPPGPSPFMPWSDGPPQPQPLMNPFLGNQPPQDSYQNVNRLLDIFQGGGGGGGGGGGHVESSKHNWQPDHKRQRK